MLLGAEFWDFLGGPGTYEEVLQVYLEVGRENTSALLEALIFPWPEENDDA